MGEILIEVFMEVEFLLKLLNLVLIVVEIKFLTWIEL